MIALATVNKAFINCQPCFSQSKMWFHYLKRKTKKKKKKNHIGLVYKEFEMIIQINLLPKESNAWILSIVSPQAWFPTALIWAQTGDRNHNMT